MPNKDHTTFGSTKSRACLQLVSVLYQHYCGDVYGHNVTRIPNHSPTIPVGFS